MRNMRKKNFNFKNILVGGLLVFAIGGGFSIAKATSQPEIPRVAYTDDVRILYRFKEADMLSTISDGKIVEVYNLDDLTEDILTNRNGKVIVEISTGTVTNPETGDGILDTRDPYFNYINYKGIPGIQTGSKILTVCIYNPNTNLSDDIIERFDYLMP